MFFQLRLPAGTAFGATLESVKKAEALIKDDHDISTYTAYVARVRCGSPGLKLQLNESFAEIVIVSKDAEARERIKADRKQLPRALSEAARGPCSLLTAGGFRCSSASSAPTRKRCAT